MDCGFWRPGSLRTIACRDGFIYGTPLNNEAVSFVKAVQEAAAKYERLTGRKANAVEAPRSMLNLLDAAGCTTTDQPLREVQGLGFELLTSKAVWPSSLWVGEKVEGYDVYPTKACTIYQSWSE